MPCHWGWRVGKPTVTVTLSLVEAEALLSMAYRGRFGTGYGHTEYARWKRACPKLEAAITEAKGRPVTRPIRDFGPNEVF